MISLLIGTLLAIGAMAFVLAPLFQDQPRTGRSRRGTGDGGHSESRAGQDAAVAALREIEFDRATGKLSDDDYVALKTRYTEQALAAMRLEDRSSSSGTADLDVEAVIRRAREGVGAAACSRHGARPEPDAVYCSECGRYLRGACAHCGGCVEAPGASYCEHCGHRLAA